jgi:hypothetical protein
VIAEEMTYSREISIGLNVSRVSVSIPTSSKHIFLGVSDKILYFVYLKTAQIPG